ncbi:hypothetical protein [Pseudofrankia inefficax]|uniref:Band 7 protein n=1 Tax=Pseudofrankia inefficax (strain DSM 45817 / CECT 9037 / DDB 130130 / EuI1c) TaxID=298654 RepID=E3IUH4_PSEI1|nr:hypothetical protein [Pseudofrankia inefficax]ADP83659.1 band 7 protein [Pseudofrankia inefficax]
MDADRKLVVAQGEEVPARQTAELAQLRATSTEQLLAAARETAAAQQVRADQAVTHLDAARAEARDAINRAADAAREPDEHTRDDALTQLATITRRTR